jgi:hypothetical protein
MARKKIGRPRKIEYFCEECHKQLKPADFYKMSRKPELDKRGYRVTICRECLTRYGYKNGINSSEDVESFQRILKKMDLPFHIDVWRSAYNAGGSTIGMYFNVLAGMRKDIKPYHEYSKYVEDDIENEALITKTASETEIGMMINDAGDDLLEILPGLWKSIDYLQHKYGKGFNHGELVEYERYFIKEAPSIELESSRDVDNLVFAAIERHRYHKALSDDEASLDVKRMQGNFFAAQKKLKYIDKGTRSETLTKLWEKVERENGSINFLDFGFDHPQDEVDLMLFLIVRHNMVVQDKDVNNLKYEDIVAQFKDIQEQYPDALDNGKISLKDVEV